MITQFAQKFYTVLRDSFIKVLNAAMQALLSTQQFNSDDANLAAWADPQLLHVTSTSADRQNCARKLSSV